MKQKTKDGITYAGATISVLLILYCAIYIFNYYSNNDILLHYPANSKIESSEKIRLTPNEIGDSIGGILNPIVGFTASILTFLAFYIQKRANDDIQAQFKIQQFESQFYEMLRLHKENVNEINIRDMLTGEKAERRNAFESMVSGFNGLLGFGTFGTPITAEEFEACYNVFFWGYSEEAVSGLSEPAKRFIEHTELETEGGKSYPIKFTQHAGYSSFLGHYNRHLFMAVEFVVSSDVITDYSEKMVYLKILRAQLSNHEQLMLFYNWVSGFGKDWENDKNRFFTEYRMIHNIWRGDVFKSDYVLGKLTELETKKVELRTKPLFEYQEGE